MRRLLALCLLAALLLCACMPFYAASPAAPAAPTASPSPTPIQTQTPAPSDGLYVINPVSAYYAAFDRDTAFPLASLGAALSSENSLDAMETRMLLDAHLSALNQAAVSVGRLTASGEYYSDSLIGPASGTGTVTPAIHSDGVFTFTFLYDNATLMAGTLESDALLFTLHTAVVEEVETESLDEETGEILSTITEQTRPDEEILRAALYKTPSDWISVVIQDEQTSILRFRTNRVRFLAAVLPEGVSPKLPYAMLLPYAHRFCSLENGVLTYFGQNHS